MTNFVEKWVQDQAELTKPDKIYWMDGTEEEARRLVDIGLTQEKIAGKPTFYKLNDKIFPNSYLHNSHPSDVARTEHLTFVCHPTKEEAGLNNNWMEPTEAKTKLNKLFDGCMRGRIMYVIPYTMGHPNSPYSKSCIQVTDSVYVAVSMSIMTRVGKEALDRIGDSDNFVKGLHSVGDLDPQRRFIMHFPQEGLVMSIGSGYGGNALLGKKCFSLRIASCLGQKEGWLAEHMIVIGIEDPSGETTYFLGAFPSACGKTNLALINAPTGYKVKTLGDDIAWLNIGKDGKLYAINPEIGFFGVVPGTSNKTNPKMIETIKNDKFFPTLFTNTALDLDTNSPWWEGLSNEAPKNMLDWQGEKYDASSGKPAAHPNSRFTVSIKNCPSISEEFDNPKGVPISGIIFGGRRKDTIPLICETFNWEHGVFAASTLGSETTAAASHSTGNVRRDPMAMLPFCGYNMSSYFAHWLNFGKKLKNPPKIFMANWFKKDENGKFIWPGFGENFRAIKWMINRIKGKADGVETPLGIMPKMSEFDLSGLNLSEKVIKKLFEINPEEWKKELSEIEQFYGQYNSEIPVALLNKLKELKEKIK